MLGAVALFLFFWCPNAAAESSRLLTLKYVAPTECPQGSEFEAEVEALLEDPKASPRGVPFDVRIVPNETGEYALTLELPSGRREISGSDCHSVVRAAALFVALLLEDPDFVPEQEVRAPAPERAADPPLAPARKTAEWFVGLSGGLDTGTLPRLGETLDASSGVLFRRVSLEAFASAGFARSQTIDAARAVRASSYLGGARLCHLTRAASLLMLGMCAGVASGVIDVEGSGLETPRRATVGLLQGLLGARLWWRFQHPLALAFEADWTSPLVRPAVYFDGPGPQVLAYEPRPGLQARVGLRWTFARNVR